MKHPYSKQSKVDIWGGIECSLNRVNDQYMDQLSLSGHYHRIEDISLFAALGIKMMRYPVLWEKHCLQPNRKIDWSFTEERLQLLREKNIEPIAGLVHHGSGPSYTSFHDGTFSTGLATYARQVAEKFPWLTYYTPINEPLTTARFCGLYGHWYPHGSTDRDFLLILLEECKATVLAMQAIRTINPHAKLIQTEDLGKTHSTPKLKYQADFENERRWLSFDLLCGRVDEQHPLWQYLLYVGIEESALRFFTSNPCPPAIIGINHYITSERYLDQRKQKFPAHTWGGNGRDTYADVEAVRVDKTLPTGPANLLKEAWKRYTIHIAITEVHLHCTREEQLRWFKYVWEAANAAKARGVNVLAVTAWAMLGSFDWCSLLTRPAGIYEVGLFDVRSLEPRATALQKMVRSLALTQQFDHPVLNERGWWQRPTRIQYRFKRKPNDLPVDGREVASRPLLIIGKSGTLGQAFSIICNGRSINHVVYGRSELDLLHLPTCEQIIKELNPWAIINTAGFVRVDEAETQVNECYDLNSVAPKYLATICSKHNIKLVTFSSDLVFDGTKNNPYVESDTPAPLNIYGHSKARAEAYVMAEDPAALIIRTSAFFGPWDQYNFVYHTLNALKHKQAFSAAHDVFISPTYVPDLVHTTLDLLLDDACGIWNLTNKGEISWAALAEEVAQRVGYSPKSFKPVSITEMGLTAKRPFYTVLNSEKSFEMPTLEHALGRYFHDQRLITL